MKVLLLHPEDDFPSDQFRKTWDLIVDFGRAPAATYECWSAAAACPVISIYDFAKEIDDLRSCGALLGYGAGSLVDRHGIDWWDVLSLGIVPELLQLLLINRLAEYIGSSCQFYSTRRFRLAAILQKQRGSTLEVLETQPGSIRRRFRHYGKALANLDAAQLSQVIQDKFDRNHKLRARFSQPRKRSNVPVILLPSAYINVSRMAVRYAERLPEENFLLMLARRSAKLAALPPNVSAASLDAYFGHASMEEAHVLSEWRVLKQKLVQVHAIFEIADRAGILNKVESNLPWLLRVRDAWTNVFDSENTIGCLSADDTNPYTRIPLLLARSRGIPALACHHGALDCWMALKHLAADFYLAKNELEYDYLVNTCKVVDEKVVLGGPATKSEPKAQSSKLGQPCAVFFTEPFEAAGWRREELNADLLPRLYALAQDCGLKLVVKLHPFESIRGCRKELRRVLGRSADDVEVITGPAADDLWQRMRFAVTVESSTALECVTRRVPVFLCERLRDSYSGYARQYARFGVGHSLESPEQIANIPQLLAANNFPAVKQESIAPETLRELFSANRFCADHFYANHLDADQCRVPAVNA
jgi:hypothetical protein